MSPVATELDPAASAAAIAPPDQPAAFDRADAKAIFLGWERLRIAFNLVLAAVCSPVALLSGPETYAAPAFWGNCFAGVLLVNVAYFAGPLAECVLDRLGLRHRSVRWALVLGGLLPTAAYGVAAVVAFPNQIGPL
ncbi:hypothetical protein [Alienimonas californiensis]|uniref:Uncharacterized protein n=1 Tax=Alienimonas californiensis TaxID=2527989 RepID=A0A517PF40_9PLAN|nr:hypothetical protein [Alienimonas californiensis]QDT17988.1 hypothetical protein CA12_41260 [Alienimonas californiensis]